MAGTSDDESTHSDTEGYETNTEAGGYSTDAAGGSDTEGTDTQGDDAYAHVHGHSSQLQSGCRRWDADMHCCW